MIRNLALGLGGLLLALVVWGVLIEPRLLLDSEAFEAEIPALPASWDGQRVVVLADFQVGMWLGNEGMAEEAVEEAVEARPALALLAGDFVYRPDSARVRRAVGIVRPLVEAGVPTLAVLGNHDYSLMHEDSRVDEPVARYLVEQLQAAGVRVLENEAVGVRVSGGGEPLWVAGIGSVWAGRSRPNEALAGLPAEAPRLVLMHNATSYRALPARSAPLAFAAHTHGGQVRLPGSGQAGSWLDIVRSGETAADGWAQSAMGAEGNRLYVNRGIGFSTVPARINCRPELTIATLKPASGAIETRGPDATTDD